ncbi:ATP-binding protein [Streptomyces sp. 372A]
MPAYQNREVDTLTSFKSREFLAVLAHGDGVERVVVEIESCRANVGQARRFARRQLALWGLPGDDDLVDRVQLVISELVSNAVVHGRTRPPEEAETVGVTLAFKRDFALGVMVTDSSSDTMVRIRPSLFADCGRGLFLVNASSDGWTAVPRIGRQGARGKAVWAFFQCPGRASLPELLPQSA